MKRLCAIAFFAGLYAVIHFGLTHISDFRIDFLQKSDFLSVKRRVEQSRDNLEKRSFPRSAWECFGDALRPLRSVHGCGYRCKTKRTQSVLEVRSPAERGNED